MDASSAFQDSLPVSSDALLAQLDAWGLAYRLHKHVPLRTVADAKSVEEAMIVPRLARSASNLVSFGRPGPANPQKSRSVANSAQLDAGPGLSCATKSISISLVSRLMDRTV